PWRASSYLFFPTRRSSDLTVGFICWFGGPRNVPAAYEAALRGVDPYAKEPCRERRIPTEAVERRINLNKGFLNNVLGIAGVPEQDRKSTRLNSSHVKTS